jgi:beta-galactosidase
MRLFKKLSPLTRRTPNFSILMLLALMATLSPTQAQRTRDCFDKKWAFHKGDVEAGQKPSLDEKGWRALDLPHDWSIEGPYDKKNPARASGAFLPCGIGWYRKSFQLPEGTKGKLVFIEFDGVYMNSEVWINGHLLGKRPNGYIGFEYNLTPFLNFKGNNVIAVRADNSLQPGSRWYSGSGIYRHVWLKTTDQVHVAHWGTQVSTPKISPDKAQVAVISTIRNQRDTAEKVLVKQTILNSEGKSVASVSESVKLKAGDGQDVSQSLNLPNPALWSPETPNLYTLQTQLLINGAVVDQYETSFGVRNIVGHGQSLAPVPTKVTFEPDKQGSN